MNWFRIKIALRLMVRQRFFTFLNLTGLATGIAAFLLIYLYVTDELSYDKFHTHSENLYRVNMTNIWIESEAMFGSTSPGVIRAIKSDIPEFENAVRIFSPYNEQLVKIPQPTGEYRSFRETDIIASGEDFFDLFSFEMLEGNPETALAQPNSAVITKSTATKYFGEGQALGEQIILGGGEDQTTVMVTGVVADVPDQSHFTFNVLLSLNTFSFAYESKSWIMTIFVTYVKLNPEADLGLVAEKLANMPAQYVGEERAQEKNWTLALQNIEDIRLYSGDISNRIGPTGSIDNVIIFGTVALVILILSCVNFMNLSTAKYTNRAKEIGLQKVFGSSKNSLKAQFLIESITYCFIAAIIGFGLAEVSRPFFNQLADKQLSLNLFANPDLVLVLFALIFTTGLVSGSYPAWFMTRFKVADAVKGKISSSGSKAGFRNLLVVFQFSISMALISSSFLVKDQLQFLQEKDLGFDEEQILVIPHLEWMKDKGELFADKLENTGLFEKTAITNSVPPNSWYQDNLKPLNSSKTTELPVTMINAQPGFVEVLDVPLVAGRSFFESGEGDQNKIIINEECAIQMEWLKPGEDPNNVLGKELVYYDEDPFIVVGVLKDFNFWALNNPIEPMAIFHHQANVWQGDFRYLTARVNEKNLASYEKIIDEVKSTWLELNPNVPFEYHFMDQEFDNAFGSQRRFGNVLNVFSIIAILIAILGLTGLIAFTTEQKTKEFGIRKVLGASLLNLVKLGLTDFIKLLAVSVLIGSFATWYFGSSWLQNFTYQSTISPGIFLIAAALIIALILIIAWFIIRNTARKNPAMVLRDD